MSLASAIGQHLRIDDPRWRAALVACGLLAASAVVGWNPRMMFLAAIVVGLGGALLLGKPAVGMFALVLAPITGRLEIQTGTAVTVNPTSMLIPTLLAVWVLDGITSRRLRLAPSRVNTPLMLFLLSSIVSLIIGNAFWDPTVGRSGSFVLVQFAQIAILAFSAGAFWLMANMGRSVAWLQRLTWLFLLVGGLLAIMRVVPATEVLAWILSTEAQERAPFWVALGALAGGQLLFNHRLSTSTRFFLVAVLGAVGLYTFVIDQTTASNWIGVAVAASILVWLRLRRLRKVMLVLAALAILVGFPLIWGFAGGEEEWDESGGSRIVLASRVIEVTMANPITGLGPAAYRLYASTRPLRYGRAVWFDPNISSHNNYVDLFAHVGIVGLGLFFWFVIEVARLGWRLSQRTRRGFIAGYVNAALAMLGASLVLMMLADWVLPFVYNIGFGGFQASVLIWLFLGGLVAVEQMQIGADAP